MTQPLLYALYCGDLYGTERMALATAVGLAGSFEPLLIAPPGAIHDAARRAGIATRSFRGYLDLARQLCRVLAASPSVVFLATRLEQSFIFWLANLWYRRRVIHRMVVHGGGGKNVYRRNRWLAPLGIGFIAVSGFVRECLIANGIAAQRIDVVDDFLSAPQLQAIEWRGPFGADGVRRVVLVSRMERVKRIDLLLDAIDHEPRLASMHFDVYGDGSELAPLRQRAAAHPNVVCHGFVADVGRVLRDHDLLLHTAPQEPFGLIILEAMAAGVPVLVADTGGPATIVRAGESGWHYRASDAGDLAARLLGLAAVPAAELDRIVANGRRILAERYSQRAAIARYREVLLHEA